MDSNDRITQLCQLMSNDWNKEEMGGKVEWDWDKIRNIKLCPYDCFNLFLFWNKRYSKNTKFLSIYEMQREILEGGDAKLFSLEEPVKNLLTNLNPENVLNEVHLPFEYLFIDTSLSIENDNIKIFGIFLQDLYGAGWNYEDYIKIAKEELSEKSEEEIRLSYEKCKEDKVIGCSVLFYLKERKTFQFTDMHFSLRTLKSSNRSLIIGEQDKYQKIIEETVSKFIANFLLFLNEPRVTIYTQETNNIRRKKKGLIPVPSLLKTKIEIGLKTYIEKIYFNGLSHSKLGFSFWVRGHWRRFLSPRFVNKQGQKIWIAPHICGEGLMPPQVFEITTSKDKQIEQPHKGQDTQ